MAKPVYRIAAVSYLNTRPLIEGLDARSDVQLDLAVPSQLLDLLRSGHSDVALLPVIDYQRMDDLVVLSGACIGADGPALTVRIFSRVPIGKIRTLQLDVESHSSNALARILLAEACGIRPELVDHSGDADAAVRIGDKVVTAPPADMPHNVDLGELWKQFTGLPFVFAAWMGRRERLSHGLLQALNQARREALGRLDAIVQQHALPRQWPAELARRYLSQILHYDLDLAPGSAQRDAIELFHTLAAAHGILPGPARALSVFP